MPGAEMLRDRLKMVLISTPQGHKTFSAPGPHENATGVALTYFRAALLRSNGQELRTRVL